MSFKASTDEHGFQDLNRRTDGIWVWGPRQTDRRDLGFKTSTNGQTNMGFRTLTDGQTSEFNILDTLANFVDHHWAVSSLSFLWKVLDKGSTSYKVRTLLCHNRPFFKGKLLAILEMVLKAFCHFVTQIFFYGWSAFRNILRVCTVCEKNVRAFLKCSQMAIS